MRDALAEVWLSATRRTLTYGIAVLSLGLGVAAFVCLCAFTRSFDDSLKRRVNPHFGSEFTVEAGPTISVEIGAKRSPLDAERVTARVRQAVGKQAAALAEGAFDVKVGRHALEDMRVLAVSGGWLKLQPHLWGIEDRIAGRLFTSQDDASGEAVCIIDPQLARALPDPADPIGQTLNVNGRPFRVVGVVRIESGLGNYGLLLLSFSAASPLLRLQPPRSMSFLVRSDESHVESEMGSVQSAISQALGSGYAVSTQSPWLDLEETRYQLSYMHLFLEVVSLLPLVVGLLGLVSMLLANLNTRVREIGLHRALGATRLRQAALVLCEAGVTGLLAGLVGIPVGAAILRVLTSAWGSDLRITSGWIAAAVLSSVGTALLAGLIPARAAMRISPCDALRAD